MLKTGRWTSFSAVQLLLRIPPFPAEELLAELLSNQLAFLSLLVPGQFMPLPLHEFEQLVL